MTEVEVPKCETNNKGGSVVGWIISLILVLVALLAWSQVKKTKAGAAGAPIDPTIKEPLIASLNYIELLTMLLWVVPLIVGLISIIWWMASKKKKTVKVDTDDVEAGNGNAAAAQRAIHEQRAQQIPIVMYPGAAMGGQQFRPFPQMGPMGQTLRCAPVRAF
jgi:cytochrome c-type biogenesis protein CcmH/NrfF